MQPSRQVSSLATLPPAAIEFLLMPGSWVHVVDPDRAETARLQEECGIPDTFITAALDVDALARMDQEQDMMLSTLQNNELLELLCYQTSLIYFLTSLESHDLMMKR